MRSWSIDDELVEKFRRDCLQPYFPYAHIAGVMAFGSAHTKKFNHANISLGGGFSNLQNTMYQFRGTYKFLHYTSLKVLFAILNSGKIRMYNLKGMDDPYEIKYAIDHLNIAFRDDYERNWKMDGYYGLSMIQPSLEKEKKSLDVWRRYGDDGRGVAIELTFNKRDIQDWQNFTLSKVYYGDSEFKFLQDWRDSYTSFHHESKFTIQGFDDVMAQLRGFHKKMAYHTEKEVRLIHSLHGMGMHSEHQLEKRKRDHKFLHPDVTAKGRPSDYFEFQVGYDGWKKLKNFTRDERGILRKIYPKVSISKVYFGYRLQKVEKIDLVGHFYEHYKDLYPKLKFDESTLTNDFQ